MTGVEPFLASLFAAAGTTAATTTAATTAAATAATASTAATAATAATAGAAAAGTAAAAAGTTAAATGLSTLGALEIAGAVAGLGASGAQLLAEKPKAAALPQQAARDEAQREADMRSELYRKRGRAAALLTPGGAKGDTSQAPLGAASLLGG
jgi:hypothetical protein